MSVTTSNGATRRCRSVTGRTVPPLASRCLRSAVHTAQRRIPPRGSTVGRGSDSQNGSRGCATRSSPASGGATRSTVPRPPGRVRPGSRSCRPRWSAIAQPLLPGGLRVDPGLGRLLGHAALPHQPLDLHPDGRVHHHNQIETALQVILGDQRDVEDDDRRLPASRSSSAIRSPTRGWTIAIQLPAQRFIGEHKLAQPVPVQGAISRQHVRAELAGPRRPAPVCRAQPPHGPPRRRRR